MCNLFTCMAVNKILILKMNILPEVIKLIKLFSNVFGNNSRSRLHSSVLFTI